MRYNYYVVTTQRADTDIYHRVARGPAGEWTMSHFWNRSDRTWYPVECTYARGVIPATRYGKRKNAHLAMLALIREAEMRPLDKITQRDRAKRRANRSN